MSSSISILVEREADQQFCLKFLTKDDPWVLHLSGISGNGKSTFLRDFKEKLDSSKICFSSIDLVNSDRKDALTILSRLSRDMSRYCDEKSVDEFKNILKQGREDIRQADAKFIQSLIVATNATVQDVKQSIAIAYDSRATLESTRITARTAVAEAFYAQVSSFHLDQFLIILDDYERFSEMESSEPESLEVRHWLIHECIPYIREKLLVEQKQRFSVIIASSIVPELPPHIYGPLPLKHNLDILDSEAVYVYLKEQGITDAKMCKDINENMIHGNACCIGIVGRILKEPQRYNLPEHFTFTELQDIFRPIAFNDFVTKYIKREPPPNDEVVIYPHKNFHLFIHYGVLLRRFNQPLLQEVFRDLFKEAEILLMFNKLIKYPYVEDRSNYCYAFTDLVREIVHDNIVKNEPPKKNELAKWQQYHQRAFEYLKQILPDYLTLELQLELYYHQLIYDEERGIAAWKNAVRDAYTSNDDRRFQLLLEIAHDKTLDFRVREALADKNISSGGI